MEETTLLGDLAADLKRVRRRGWKVRRHRSEWRLTPPSGKPTVVQLAVNASWSQAERTISGLDPTASDAVQIIAELIGADSPDRHGTWRTAVYVVEATTALRDDGASTTRHDQLALLRWVRWRLLSEPFRDADDHLRRFAEQAFPDGRRELWARAVEARERWASTLLTQDDWPSLADAPFELEDEADLIVFHDRRLRHILELSSVVTSPADPASRDRRGRDPFITWFVREFYGRRYQVRRMWQTLPRRRTKRLVMWSGLVAVAAASFVGFARPNLQAAAFGTLVGATVLFSVGLLYEMLRREGDQRATFPFLLRYPASCAIGAAAVVAARGVWIPRLAAGATMPADCPAPPPIEPWRTGVLIGGLALVGLFYLMVEVRFHGVSHKGAIRRALGVWAIGAGWAAVIAGFVISLLGPLLIECFPEVLTGPARAASFSVISLVALDLGLVLQVLWEDRPITYPLGSLGFSDKS